MPSPFEFSPLPDNEVALGNGVKSRVNFTVKNVAGRRLNAVTSIKMTQPDTTARDWIKVLPDENDTPQGFRTFDIGETQTYTVEIAPPEGTEAGQYAFQLVVADEFNPEENFSNGPDLRFEVKGAPPPPPANRNLLIIGAVVAVIAVIVIGGLIAVLSSGDDSPQAEIRREVTLRSTPEESATPDGPTLTVGEQVPISRQTEDGNWYEVEYETEEGDIVIGWVPAGSVNVTGDAERIVIVPDPTATPTPTATVTPTATTTPTPTQTPTNTPTPDPILSRLDRISGRITWNGQPVSGITMALISGSTCNTLQVIQRTDSDINGIYHFLGVSPGQYRLAINGWNGTGTVVGAYSQSCLPELRKNPDQAARLNATLRKTDLNITFPANNAEISNTRPTLRWDAYPGATRYEVVLSRRSPSFENIAFNEASDGLTYRPSSALANGRYELIVWAWGNNGQIAFGSVDFEVDASSRPGIVVTLLPVTRLPIIPVPFSTPSSP